MTTPFPFGLPHSDPDPETKLTGPKKPVFPGSRPAVVTADPQRDGDTGARKTTDLPFARPVPSVDLVRDGNAAQTNNVSYGGGFGPSGVFGRMYPGSIAPDAVQGARHYVDPNPLTNGGVNTVEHAGVSGSKKVDYLPPYVPNDPEHFQPRDLAVPSAPGSASATAGVTSATVSFVKAASAAPVTGYTVTSTPGGKTGTGTGSPIVVTGLTAATNYTFTVHATNRNGDSAESTASGVVKPT